MLLKFSVKQTTYFDSITLMAVTRLLSGMPGIEDAAVVMATEPNLLLLAEVGLCPPELPKLAPSDLLYIVRADSEESAATALRVAEEHLMQRVTASTQEQLQAGEAPRPRSLEQALGLRPRARFVSISVPGPYAALECQLALRAGLHVFLFSDNVPLEDEIALKHLAETRNLLLMGPDCGTALLQGLAFGFVNVVPRGPVGIVGASGTGIQQVMSLLAHQGVGVSQVIGCGGRDLSAPVGGITTRQGLRLLQEDPETQVIVLISKPPDREVAAHVLGLAEEGEKPVVVCFVGASDTDTPRPATKKQLLASNLTDAARLVCEVVRGATSIPSELKMIGSGERLAAAERRIAGLFSGGTLCDEAMHLWKEWLTPIYSNIPLRPEWQLQAGRKGHCAIDFGADEYTRGRPHPMIDPTLRLKRFEDEVNDPTVGVVLLDMVLGYCSHPDPASVYAPVIQKALERAADRPLRCVISLCGTEGDPQTFSRQAEAFRGVGADVYLSNAEAALRCLELLQQGENE